MTIKYNDIDNSLHINDDVKSRYFFLKFLMILNIINTTFRLLNINETGFGTLEIIWSLFGAISLVVLYNLIFKKSTLETISIHQIEQLKEKSIFGTKRYSLELTNGKSRTLSRFKSPSEFLEFQKLVFKFKIKN